LPNTTQAARPQTPENHFAWSGQQKKLRRELEKSLYPSGFEYLPALKRVSPFVAAIGVAGTAWGSYEMWRDNPDAYRQRKQEDIDAATKPVLTIADSAASQVHLCAGDGEFLDSAYDGCPEVITYNIDTEQGFAAFATDAVSARLSNSRPLNDQDVDTIIAAIPEGSDAQRDNSYNLELQDGLDTATSEVMDATPEREPLIIDQPEAFTGLALVVTLGGVATWKKVAQLRLRHQRKRLQRFVNDNAELPLVKKSIQYGYRNEESKRDIAELEDAGLNSSEISALHSARYLGKHSSPLPGGWRAQRSLRRRIKESGPERMKDLLTNRNSAQASSNA
jgi:hypothetical protein